MLGTAEVQGPVMSDTAAAPGPETEKIAAASWATLCTAVAAVNMVGLALPSSMATYAAPTAVRTSLLGSSARRHSAAATGTAPGHARLRASACTGPPPPPPRRRVHALRHQTAAPHRLPTAAQTHHPQVGDVALMNSAARQLGLTAAVPASRHQEHPPPPSRPPLPPRRPMPPLVPAAGAPASSGAHP